MEAIKNAKELKNVSQLKSFSVCLIIAIDIFKVFVVLEPFHYLLRKSMKWF